MARWSKAWLREQLRRNSALRVEGALDGVSLSADVRQLNDAGDLRRYRGGEDTADALLAELARHAPDLATHFVRDWPVGRWRIDLAIPARHLGIECNGGYARPRGGKHGSDRDHQKIRALQRAGWMIYQFTAHEIRSDPLGVVAEIRAIVGATS
jgi:very-short-patch-repair endonuclease